MFKDQKMQKTFETLLAINDKIEHERYMQDIMQKLLDSCDRLVAYDSKGEVIVDLRKDNEVHDTLRSFLLSAIDGTNAHLFSLEKRLELFAITDTEDVSENSNLT